MAKATNADNNPTFVVAFLIVCNVFFILDVFFKFKTNIGDSL
jgi:hypothetical protein